MVNNNQLARERDRRRDEFLDVSPASYEQLVKAGIYPTEAKAGERCKLAADRGEIAVVGHVKNLEGRWVVLVSRFEVDHPQHEYEVTELILAARPKGFRRGHQVGKYLADAELLYDNGEVHYLERERTRKNLSEVSKRIRQYDGCEGAVCWIINTDSRIKNILETCKPGPNHWFTTYHEAVKDWNNAPWQQYQSSKQQAS